jgi:acylglycerol lipase
VVCLVHGLGEHSGRYAHVAAALTKAGYALQAFDLRGHGDSQGRRGHAPTWEALLDDISLCLAQAASRFPDAPLFLYGHSLGGTLVLTYCMSREAQLTGVIATSPLLRPAFQPPAWKIALAQLMYSLWPTFSLNNELDPSGICRDRAVVQAYVNDRRVHDRLSARLGLDMLRAGEWILRHSEDLTVPVLLMYGSADRLCSPEAIRQFAEHVNHGCTCKCWDGLYHEIHNEPEKHEVLRTIIEWLEAHTVIQVKGQVLPAAHD